MELKAETNAYFEGVDASHYPTGIDVLKLQQRYNKCITLDENYVEQ